MDRQEGGQGHWEMTVEEMSAFVSSFSERDCVWGVGGYKNLTCGQEDIRSLNEI